MPAITGKIPPLGPAGIGAGAERAARRKKAELKPVVEEPVIPEPTPPPRGEYLTVEQAKEQYGVDLDPGWQLRITTHPQMGTRVSYVAPDKWIYSQVRWDEAGNVIDYLARDPEGKMYGKEELEAPEIPTLERERLEEVTELVFPEEDIESLFQSMAITPDMPEEDRLLAGQAQDEFLDAIQTEGRTWQTETLLKQLGVPEEQIGEFFALPVLEADATVLTSSIDPRIISGERTIPTEGMEFPAQTVGGADFQARLEPDGSVWWGSRELGRFDLKTGEYRDFTKEKIEDMPKWARVWGAGWGDVATAAAGAMYRIDKQDQADWLMRWGTELREASPEMEEVKYSDIRMLSEKEFWWQQLRSLPFIQASFIAGGGFGAIGGGAVAARFGGGTLLSKIGMGIGYGTGQSIPEALMEAGMAYNEAKLRGFNEDGCNEVYDRVLVWNMKILPPTNTLEGILALCGVKFPGGKVVGRVGGVLTVSATEGTQEVLQDVGSRQALGDVVTWDKSMTQQFLSGAVMGLMFGVGGNVMQTIQARSAAEMPAEMKTQFDKDKAGFLELGLDEEQAGLQALDEIAQTEEGGELIETVAKKIQEEEEAKPPVVKPPEIPERPAVPEVIAEATLSLGEISKYETRTPLDLIRKDEPETLARLTEEIKREGITEPITIRVREDGSRIVWDGIHRLIVAQDLGIKTIPVKFIGERVGIPEVAPPVVKPPPPVKPPVVEVKPLVEVKAPPIAEVELITKPIMEVEETFIVKKVTPAEIKKSLVDYIKREIPLPVRGRLLTQVKNVKTERDLGKAIAQAKKYAEQHDQRVLRSRIRKEIKGITPRKVAGILKGKFTPEVQRKLDSIKRNLEIDRDEVRGKIADAIHAYERGEISYDEMLESNELLNIAGIKGMSADELQVALDDIQSIEKTGRTLRAEAIAKEKERIDAIKEDVIGVITGGKGLKPGIGTVPARQLEATKGWLEKLVNWQYSWDNFLDKLSKFHKSAPYKSPLSKFGNKVHYSREMENSGLARTQGKVRENFSRIFETTNRGRINQTLMKFQEEKIELGTFRNLDGEVVTLTLTKDQIMNKYQQLQDPTLDKTFTEGMRWTEGIKQAVIGNLSVREKAWADYQMEFYQEYYVSINEIYTEIYGIDLSHNLNYTPIKRDLETEVPENVLTYRDISRYASVLNGSLKSRVQNKIPLKFNGATGILMNHIQQMEHFKAWAYTMRDMRRVFGDKEVRTAIRQYHGSPILRTVDGYLNDMARGGVEKALINRGADFLRRNFTRSILSIKPVIGLKQIPSVLAYTTEMPIGDFVTGVADFWAHPIENYRFLIEHSVYAEKRFGMGFERDIKFAMETSPVKQLSGKSSVAAYFMLQIRLGDKLAVTQGMWAKYKSEMKGKPATPENIDKAMLEAKIATDRTQPSFDLESLSPLQKGGSWVKLLTMFQNQPNKYFRIIGNNARNFKYGRGSRAKAASNIFLAWVVAPCLFQFIADAFQFKKKHQLRALVLGPLNWILIFSQMAQSVYGWVTDEPYDYQASPVLATARDIKVAVMKAVKLVKQYQDPYQNISMDDLIAMTEFFAKAAGQFLGYPTPWLVQAERGIREGQPLELVFSRWALRKPEKDDAGKAKDEIGNLGKTKLDIELASDIVEVRRKAEEEAREREEAEAKGLTVEPLDIFDMGDLDNEMNRIYGDTLPDDVIADKNSPPEAKAWAEMAKSRAIANTQPDIPLYKINTDKEKDDTIIQYYQQWRAREGIDNLADLKEFDRLYPDANLGNVSRRQYNLLVKYLETPEDKKRQFTEDHPELKVNLRNEWLKDNPVDNARLAIWGEAKILSQEAYNEVQRLVKKLDIPDDAIPEFTLPPEGSVESHFKYLETGEEFGWNSWETQLVLAQDDAYREWKGLDPVETPIPALELKVKHRELSDLYDDYSDKDSPLYIEGDDARDEARDKLRTDNPEWVDDMRRIEAIEHGATDKIIENWVGRGKLVDEFSAGSSEVKVWLIDHKETWDWALEQELLTDDGSDWNEAVLRINVEMATLIEDSAQYNLLKRKKGAYTEGFPETQIDNYVAYYELPVEGYRQERFLIENPEFAKSMHELKDIDIPEKVPSVEYDILLEKKDKTPEDERRMEAYKRYFPEEHIDAYVGWYETERADYEDDWFLMENKGFYRAMVDEGILQSRDFSNVPSRRVYELYLIYTGLPLGQTRLDYRAQNLDLERWLVEVKGYTPLEGRGDKGADISGAEQLAIDIAEGLERIKALK